MSNSIGLGEPMWGVSCTYIRMPLVARVAVLK